jgi:hypothetical protein
MRSISSDFKSHFGVGRGRCLREAPRRRCLVIVFLPSQRDRLFHVSQPHQEPLARQRDRQVAVPKPPHQVEGLALRAGLGQRQGVLRHSLFDGLPHLWSGSEEAIRRHRAPDPLMRAAEVVGLDEERNPALAVLKVRTHRPRQEFLPQRLPKPLDLAQGLRVVGTALDVSDALTPQLPLEVGVPTPGHVLPSLVGQHLLGRAVLRDAAGQRLQDQRGALVMGHHQRHHVPRVVVHEGGHVQSLVTPQEKREDVRLPELIRLRTLKAMLRRTRLGRGLGYFLQ